MDPSLLNASCGNDFMRLTGVTQLGPPTGLNSSAVARLIHRAGITFCSNTTAGALVIPASPDVWNLSFIIGAETNYDQAKET